MLPFPENEDYRFAVYAPVLSPDGSAFYVVSINYWDEDLNNAYHLVKVDTTREFLWGEEGITGNPGWNLGGAPIPDSN